MRILLACLAALSLSTAALAGEVSVSRQTHELTTRMGGPPPAGAVKLPDAGGESWLYEQQGVLFLTARSSAAFTGWATFQVGPFEAWRLVGEEKGRVVVEATREGRAVRIVFDLRKVHAKASVKFTIQ